MSEAGEAVNAAADGSIDESAGESEPEATEATESTQLRWPRMRWVFTRGLCFGGLAGALVLFFLSFMPSLVPRASLLQGVASGLSAATGYGLGSALSAGIRKVIPREPSTATKRIAWWALAGSAAVVVPLALWLGAVWQTDVRRLMGMDNLASYAWLLITLIAVLVALIVLLISRLVRGANRMLIRFLDRFIPRPAAVGVGVGAVVLLIFGLVTGVLLDGMLSVMNSRYSSSDTGTSAWISQPQSELRSGGPGSLVEWDSLGLNGRDFAGDGGGPTVEQISEFSGEQAMEPIRVYVGLRSADSLEERVDLAMQELERTGAFERSTLVVITSTGTGWVDENAADSLEFLYNGDTAEVSMQYSYLPSWASFLADRSTVTDAGAELIGAVTERMAELPEGDRPQLLVFGESLGSMGTESAFENLDDLLERTDGALFVGPTFSNPIHNDLTADRDEGSPSWRPIIDGGTSIRIAEDTADLYDEGLYPTGSQWIEPRVVYLQNSSDPIGYFNTELLYREPEWLNGQRGPDVSDGMFWVPVVSFLQLALDTFSATDVPAGHGHQYGSAVVDGWVAIAEPDGWTDDDTAALRELIDARADEREEK